MPLCKSAIEQALHPFWREGNSPLWCDVIASAKRLRLKSAMLCDHALASLNAFVARHSHTHMEELLTLFFARDGRLIAEDRATGQSGWSVDLPVRRIAARALLLEAQDILLAHNHPSGDPSPSRQDILATNRLERALFPFAIRVMDHVIISGNRSFSFRHAGLL